MSTLSNKTSTNWTPTRTSSPVKTPEDRQRTIDRWTAFLAIALVVALMAAMIWLASLGGVEANNIDYWPMMP